jgi:hypothetical protein
MLYNELGSDALSNNLFISQSKDDIFNELEKLIGGKTRKKTPTIKKTCRGVNDKLKFLTEIEILSVVEG